MEFYRRRQKWILLLAAVGFSGYGVYKVYHLPSVSRKRKKLSKLVGSLIAVAEAVSSSAETVSLVSSDLNSFLHSDSDEIPASLKQVSKIVRSDEFAISLSRVSEALTVGMVRGFSSNSTESDSRTSSSFSDRLLDKVFSSTGSGFASVIVGSFARNLVLAFYSRGSDAGGPSVNLGSSDVPGWVHLIYRDECRELIADSIQVFVSTAVAVFLDKTMEINTYDEFFSGLTNPKHESKVTEILVSLCNGAVETLVKTSHEVVTYSNSSSSMNRMEGLGPEKEKLSTENDKESGGWVDRVSSSLAVPSNKRFVLDLTGRVTFETVRSFLDFLLLKLYDGARGGMYAVWEEVVEKGLGVVRYFSAKSRVIATICLSLCMNVFARTRILLPV